MSRVRFREQMKGWLSFDEDDYNQALHHGRTEGMAALLRLTIDIRDLDRFLDDRSEAASVSGMLECEALGGRLAVESGSTFELFAREPDRRHLRMRYRLFLRDGRRQPLTLSGFKVLEDDPNYDSWRDSTTLFTRVHSGHVAAEEERAEMRVATGILRVTPFALVKQLISYRGGLRPVARFLRFFLLQLARAYSGPPVGDSRPSFPYDRVPGPPPVEPDWEPVPGKPRLERMVIDCQTPFPLNLHRLRHDRAAPHGTPVLLSHGAGLRAQIFYGQPSGQSLAERLLDEGYDVWVQNWRGSIDFPPRDYTLDQVAREDHPASVEAILERTDASRIKAIVHCQGSISFTMAAIEGLLPAVSHVVTNCVSLHVRVTPRSRVKQLFMLPVADLLLSGADPQWGIRSPAIPTDLFTTIAKTVRAGDSCDNPVCKRASYQYGTGPHVLLWHRNVAPDVHAWIGRELGYAPFRLINQLVKSVGARHVVPARGEEGPRDRYVRAAPRTDAVFTFVAGSRNVLFTPDGQRASYEHFSSYGKRAFHAEVPDFGHLDTLIGREAPEKVFPAMIEGLER